jgi:hypothetical protein
MLSISIAIKFDGSQTARDLSRRKNPVARARFYAGREAAERGEKMPCFVSKAGLDSVPKRTGGCSG